MTSTLHRTRRISLRVRIPSFPRSSPVSTLSPLFLIWSSVESWPAKNQDPPILSGTMPEQYQNGEIRDLKCPPFTRGSCACSFPDDYSIPLPYPQNPPLIFRGDFQLQGLLNVSGNGRRSILPEHGLLPIRLRCPFGDYHLVSGRRP